MKKYILPILSLALFFTFFSCEKEVETWDSATTDYDGNWYVRYDHSTDGEDFLGVGYTENFTYNTASNMGDSIWLEDHGNFWDYKLKVPVNPVDLTFGGTDTLIDTQYGIKVVITNGKIIKDAVTLPSNLVVDSIYYEVWFEDFEGWYGSPGTLLVGGYRQTGFDEDHR